MYEREHGSHLIQEDYKFLKFNDDGETWLVSGGSFDDEFSYRKVHYTHEDKWKPGAFTHEKFCDPEYTVKEDEFEGLILGDRKIILKRLYDLYKMYPENERPKFFPKKKYRFDRVTNLT